MLPPASTLKVSANNKLEPETKLNKWPNTYQPNLNIHQYCFTNALTIERNSYEVDQIQPTNIKPRPEIIYYKNEVIYNRKKTL